MRKIMAGVIVLIQGNVLHWNNNNDPLFRNYIAIPLNYLLKNHFQLLLIASQRKNPRLINSIKGHARRREKLAVML